MTGATDLVARSGELKRDLLAYARRPRYDRAFRDFLATQDPATLRDDQHMIMLMDHFVLQHRLGNGKTVVEQFVASHTGLDEVDWELLLGWRDVVEGIFEVHRRDGPALIVENLIDDLTYRVRSTMGPQVFRRMPRRSFLITRLVPCGTEWLISGATSVLPAAHHDRVLQVAAETAARTPELVFRNPTHLAKGWALQRAERERFIRFFGSDVVVVPGDQVADRLRQYQDFSHREVPADPPPALWTVPTLPCSTSTNWPTATPSASSMTRLKA